MREDAFCRMTIRLSSDMLERLSAYTRQTGAPSDSASVQFILLTFLNRPEGCTGAEKRELHLAQDRRTSFSLSRQSLNELERLASERAISKAACLRLALFYSLYN